MTSEDRRILLTVALELRLAARARVTRHVDGLSAARMIEMADSLQGLGDRDQPSFGIALGRR